jgi:hypothetical protein
MSEYLDALERGFVGASRRLSARKRRTRRRRGACAAAIVVLIGAPALAATGVWRPKLGDDRTEGATITGQAPPAAQLKLLGVLRREQTAADRGARTREALTMVGKGVAGVRTNSIRLLAQTKQDRGIVLIPVARYQLNQPKLPADAPAGLRARFEPARNGLCVFTLDSDHGKPAGAGVACYSTQDVEQGRAQSGLGDRAAWLVPDGVASLKIEYRDGRSVTASVHDNLALYTAPSYEWLRVMWYAADGRVMKELKAPPVPTGPRARQYPAQYDPLARGARRTGRVLRVATRATEGVMHIELLVKPRLVKRPLISRYGTEPLTLLLTRPACSGKRDVVQRNGSLMSPRKIRYQQFDITPSTGDFNRAKWCPGHYRGALRAHTGVRIVGTFAFDVR